MRGNSIETQILEPCMEFIEKMERAKGCNNFNVGELQNRCVELEKYIQGGGV